MSKIQKFNKEAYATQAGGQRLHVEGRYSIFVVIVLHIFPHLCLDVNTV